MMEISDRMRAAILQSARDSQAEARVRHAHEPDVLISIGKVESMIYELEVASYMAGSHNPMLAVAFQEALEAVQAAIDASDPTLPEAVIRVANPYV